MIREFLLRNGILENFLALWNFKAGKSTSELVCQRTADPEITVLWIKEVEVAKSIDELITSRSITGQHKFPDFDMLDAMIASALKSAFRKRESVEEQRAQNSDRYSYEEDKWRT